MRPRLSQVTGGVLGQPGVWCETLWKEREFHSSSASLARTLSCELPDFRRNLRQGALPTSSRQSWLSTSLSPLNLEAASYSPGLPDGRVWPYEFTDTLSSCAVSQSRDLHRHTIVLCFLNLFLAGVGGWGGRLICVGASEDILVCCHSFYLL